MIVWPVGTKVEFQLTLKAVDAKTGRKLRRDTLDVTALNMIVRREKFFARAEGPLAAALARIGLYR